MNAVHLRLLIHPVEQAMGERWARTMASRLAAHMSGFQGEWMSGRRAMSSLLTVLLSWCVASSERPGRWPMVSLHLHQEKARR